MNIQGLQGMYAEAERFVAEDLSRVRATATVVALSGDLGAGKTSFAQGVARALGVGEDVTSPTFVIEKIYTLTGQVFARLIHIDAYRLTQSQELKVLGWDEICRDPSNLIVIEWPEHVADSIPSDAIKITLTGSGDERVITYN